MADDRKLSTIRDRVAEAGRLLYGDRWQSDLARDLNVSTRAMQSWFASPTSSSYREMPAGILHEVGVLADARADALLRWRQLVGELETADMPDVRKRAPIPPS